MKLTYDDNERLIEMAQKGDEKALEKALKLNSPLAYKYASKFINKGYDLEDLIQIALMGLFKAIKKFDDSYNVRFSSYAVPMIVGELKRHIRDNNPFHVKREVATLKTTIGYHIAKLSEKLQREPTIEELSEKTQKSVEDLNLALSLNNLDTVASLNGVIFEREGPQITLEDKLAGNSTTEDRIIENLALEEAIEQLPDELRQIITLKYFEGATQTQIGDMMGLTQVTVSRKEKKALKMLKELLEQETDEGIYIEQYKAKIDGLMTRDKLRIAL